MCGIAGYLTKQSAKQQFELIETLMAPLRKRGPDDEGVCLINREQQSFRQFRTESSHSYLSEFFSHYQDTEKYPQHDLGLLHTRFSIIDLTPSGHQPFVSHDQNIIGVFNGEIYNYIELREDLANKGIQFKTNTDTEVFVEGFRYYGHDWWKRCNGFWAAVFYDLKQKCLIFSRDRMGVAPLYFYHTHDGFFFSSYLESLLALELRANTVNHNIVQGYLDYGMKDFEETTFYEHIYTFPAGCVATLSINDFQLSEKQFIPFWKKPNHRLEENDIPFDDAVKKLRELLFDSVRLRLRADVRVAFELSGGLDSSSVVAAASILKKNKVHTFTCKVEHADEEPYARTILKKYPVTFSVIQESKKPFHQYAASFMETMEEPFDNPNAFIHHQMLQEMKGRGYDVVLTGAGGDEVLAGYEGNFWPKAYQELSQKSLKDYFHADAYEFSRRYKNLGRAKNTWSKIVKSRLGFNGSGMQIKTPSRAKFWTDRYRRLSFHEQQLYHFNVALLPYYMRSSDHFTMGVPIEHRFPLLDYRLVEFGLQLPITYLFKQGWTKYILRKAMEPYLPPEIIWRHDKKGFTYPYQQNLNTFKSTFLKYFNEAYTVYPAPFNDYNQYLAKDPVRLWRYISVGLWLKMMKDKDYAYCLRC